jgi:hypothetical protein
MPKTQSLASQKRERQRTHPKTLEFKAKVSALLQKAKPEVAYAIKRDLSVMTNMPFYKDRPEKMKLTLTPIQLVNEYVRFFCICEDKEFIAQLLKKLSINQSQTIRKVAPKIGEVKEIWEHVIPTKVIVDEMK